ncbi:MAG: sulfite exporter TauE/SafE family protein [Gaiellaceae bacterium MAG52_C11]|nr:sulfite exporter TauE/SafE family protein [Candidatus Gaiellasilicea maunaloa]
MRRLLLLVVALTALALPVAASAHPLGNFTVNRYSRIQPSGDRIYVLYVLDLAEIPTFRERAGARDPEAYATATARKIGRGLKLSVAGAPLSLEPLRHQIAFPAGASGLRTTRLQIVYRSPRIERSGGPLALRFSDTNFAGRVGWQEIVVRAVGGASISSSSVPAQSISDELLAYPKDLLKSPPDVTGARARFEPGSGAGPVPTLLSAEQLASRVAVRNTADGGFAKLIAEDELSLGFVLVSLLVALFWGAAHAFSPGHGKAIVAGYLIGTRGRPRDAFMLGLIVTVTHTAGVFALGGITLLLSEFIVPEQLYPWLNLVSALLVLGVGLTILRWRIRVWRRGTPLGGEHSHDHSEGGHSHGGHSHSHSKAGEGRGGLLGIGISAGIIPCPTALVVLLAAISLQRVGYGLVLIVAFSVGLAAAVTGIGLIAVTARRTFSRMSLDGPAIRALPAISAIAVLGLGVVMTLRALPSVL